MALNRGEEVGEADLWCVSCCVVDLNGRTRHDPDPLCSSAGQMARHAASMRAVPLFFSLSSFCYYYCTRSVVFGFFLPRGRWFTVRVLVPGPGPGASAFSQQKGPFVFFFKKKRTRYVHRHSHVYVYIRVVYR